MHPQLAHEGQWISHHQRDSVAGIVQRRLSNGMRLNYWHTQNEPRAAMIRVVAAGGRASEGAEAGPSGVGAVVLGARTLSESGTVGPWRRDQVELFCLSRLLNCILETDEEFAYMDCHCAVGEPPAEPWLRRPPMVDCTPAGSG